MGKKRDSYKWRFLPDIPIMLADGSSNDLWFFVEGRMYHGYRSAKGAWREYHAGEPQWIDSQIEKWSENLNKIDELSE